jgi:hypothetical protein
VSAPWCRRLWRPVIATALLVSVAACAGSQPATTVTASPRPAGATVSPSPAPTPIATLSPTPAPVPSPAAPSELNWELPCLITMPRTCSGGEIDPINATWTPSASPVDGYRLYYTTGVADFCAGTWTANGTASLIGSLDSTTHGWSGRVPSFGGKLSVVAFNGGSSSVATFSSPVDPTEPMCPPA